MNKKVVAVAVVGSLFLFPNAVPGQGFLNLDFESATVSPAPPEHTPFDAFNPLSAASALPGWTVREDDTVCTAVWGAPVALDETSVALVSIPYSPLQGGYSVGFSAIAEAPPPYYQTSSISQTGLIPAGSQSIQFLVANRNPNLSLQAPPILTIDAVPINLTTVSESRGVFTMAGDVTAYAGGIATITFLCEAPGTAIPENYFNLDQIQFSNQAVPEPSVLALAGVGLVFLIWRLRNLPNRECERATARYRFGSRSNAVSSQRVTTLNSPEYAHPKPTAAARRTDDCRLVRPVRPCRSPMPQISSDPR